jgi:hypothetical protein
MVYFKKIFPSTRAAWGLAAVESGLYFSDEFSDKSWLETGQAALLYFELGALEDRPEWFPDGKSASLEYFRTLIEQAVREELANPAYPPTLKKSPTAL